jgi:hypothetical protein
MDSFLNLAKQGYEAYSDSQSNVSKTGGQEYNSPHHSQQDGRGGQGHGAPYIDHDEAVQQAQNYGPESGDSSVFSSALKHLNKNQHEHNEPVDEEEVQESHRQAYSKGSAGSLSAGSMGGAAAMQVLKQFTSGGGGGGSTQLVSMAMAEASKLFDSAGGASSGSKQDAVNGAAMTVMKLMVQSKLSGAMGGGNSGGMGSLMGLASKFM